MSDGNATPPPPPEPHNPGTPPVTPWQAPTATPAPANPAGDGTHNPYGPGGGQGGTAGGGTPHGGPAHGAQAYGAPTYGAPQVGGTGWTPPSHPHFIPLRPMTLGTLLGGSFRIVRRNPKPLIGLAVTSQLLIGLLSGILFTASLLTFVDRIENVRDEDLDQVLAGGITAMLLVTLAPMFINIVIVALLQGIVAIDVSRAMIGEKLTLRQLWARGRGRFWALIGWTLLLFTASFLGFGILAGIVVVLALAFGVVGTVIGVLLAIVLGLGLLVLTYWIGTKLSLVPAALMIERLRLGAALRRSWRLTDRNFWRVLGIQLLVAVIVSFAIQIISTPVSFLLPMVSVLIDPNQTDAAVSMVVTLGLTILAMAFTFAITAVALVVQSATSGLLYVDLRMRKEGLELDLSRHIEERDSGATDLTDPYLPAQR